MTIKRPPRKIRRYGLAWYSMRNDSGRCAPQMRCGFVTPGFATNPCDAQQPPCCDETSFAVWPPDSVQLPPQTRLNAICLPVLNWSEGTECDVIRMRLGSSGRDGSKAWQTGETGSVGAAPTVAAQPSGRGPDGRGCSHKAIVSDSFLETSTYITLLTIAISLQARKSSVTSDRPALLTSTCCVAQYEVAETRRR